MIAFAKRNLKLYFRDKTSVFFSLLAVLIIIGLYILFLGDVWTENLAEFPNAREFVDNWVMAGILAVTSVTTTMAILSNMVRDKETNISKDFYISPIKKGELIGGYLISAMVVGIIMSILSFFIAEVYIISSGGRLLSVINALKVLGLIILTTFMNTSMMYFLVSFFQTTNSFATASSLIGTLIGFITGIYLPVGMYPEGVQWIIKIFPTSHAVLLFRQVMMEDAMKTAFLKAPESVVADIKGQFGMTFQFGTYTLTQTQSLLVLAVSGIAFYGLAFLFQRRTKK